ncbi:hypothetical protein FHS31_000322 [Sphingomonas vulcanisoli]|uniref:MBG domain-containing protein n=1 Tax=Sphingomonas vulcanisoli TaxID=1658060 RepID=A0ABX0TQ55_9SPHN|nr:hypothetical protein [Sphingomonas vulcanisoli]
MASLSGVYGTPSPVLTVTGLTGLDTAQPFLQSDGSTVSLQYLGSDTYGYVASAGTHSFVFNGITGGAASNYSYDLNSAPRTGTYTVTPKPITFSVADRSRTFRTTDVLPTITLNGLVGADYGTIAGQLSLNGSAVTAYNDIYALNAGTYGLSVGALSGSGASNYSIAPTGNHIGVYTVTPATIFYSVGNASSTYGTVASLPTASLFGTYFADSVQGVVGASQNNAAVALGTHTSVGTYQLSVTGLTGANAGNYTVSTVGNTLGTLTINPKALTYTVGGGSFVYGQTIAASGLSFAGVLSGDTVSGGIGISSSNIQGQTFDATIGRRGVGTWYLGLTGLTGAQAGDYVIAATGNSYGLVSVTPKPLTYSIAGGSVVYGDGTALPTAALSGIESGDIVVPDATLIKSGTSLYAASTMLPVGSYATTLTGIGGDSAFNYTLANSGVATGTVSITPRPVTAAVVLSFSDSSVSYGLYQASSTIGFANLDNVLPADQSRVSAIVTSPLLPASGSGSLKVGTYGFTATGLTGSQASNYRLAGSDTLQLTVTPRVLSAAYYPLSSTYGTVANLGLPTLSGIIAGEYGDVRRRCGGGERRRRQPDHRPANTGRKLHRHRIRPLRRGRRQLRGRSDLYDSDDQPQADHLRDRQCELDLRQHAGVRRGDVHRPGWGRCGCRHPWPGDHRSQQCRHVFRYIVGPDRCGFGQLCAGHRRQHSGHVHDQSEDAGI